MKRVRLKAKTEEANDILNTYGDIWEVRMETHDAMYGSMSRLLLSARSDKRQRSMWIKDNGDELFDVEPE